MFRVLFCGFCCVGDCAVLEVCYLLVLRFCVGLVRFVCCVLFMFWLMFLDLGWLILVGLVPLFSCLVWVRFVSLGLIVGLLYDCYGW